MPRGSSARRKVDMGADSLNSIHLWIQTICVAIVCLTATAWLARGILATLYAAWLICPPKG